MENQANDNYSRYFTEKLWEWIPAIYKTEDALAEPKHVMRALIQVIAEQAAARRRSIDRLWEDQHIEHCDDWAVAYLGDLVGARLVPALNRRGRRVDVAKTIFYRRRKGTMFVLDQLLVDMTGWDGVIVESFRRLARAWHGLDPRPGPRGRYTHTPRGGTADLRQQRGTELVDGPWDEFSHTPDYRRRRGLAGRDNISKLNVHLYRLQPYELRDATPYELVGGERYTFDPSGRDIPLFMPPIRPEAWRPRAEWAVAGSIRCRLLGHAEYELPADIEVPLLPAQLETLRSQAGLRFRDEFRLRQTLDALDPGVFTDPAIIGLILEAALVTETGKYNLVGSTRAVAVTADDGGGPSELLRAESLAGDLTSWGANLTMPDDKRVVIDAEKGRFWFNTEYVGDPPAGVGVPVYHYGFSGPIGAGPFNRLVFLVDEQDLDGAFSGGTITPPGVWAKRYQIDDSKTYPAIPNITEFTDLTMQARSGERPYLRRPVNPDNDWVFTPNNADASLVLDGLWFGGGDLVLEGEFRRVVIRHCTLDPGGARADGSNILNTTLLLRSGSIEELVIERSIINTVRQETPNPGAIGKITVVDSIIAGRIFLPGGELTIERATVRGFIDVARIYASELIALGKISVADHQRGCVRFSVYPPTSEAPPAYRSHDIEIPEHYFVSQRFGDPGFLALSESAPDFLVRGAENGAEIGAFNLLANPIKLDSLRAKFDEFMPFGRVAQLIREN